MNNKLFQILSALVVLFCGVDAFARGRYERNSDSVHLSNVKKAEHELNIALDKSHHDSDHASLAAQQSNKSKKKVVDAAETLVEAAEERLRAAQRALDTAQSEYKQALDDAAVQWKEVAIMDMSSDLSK